jgi:hypothetical protein
MAEIDNLASEEGLETGKDAKRLTKAEISFIEKTKSTKFALSLLVIALVSGLLITSRITAPIFSEVLQFVVGAYILGNTFQNSKWGK